jgi:hypothetical protein
LVVVIVIIGIIAAMAIPRLSRGTAGAVNSPPSVVADIGGWIYNPNTGEFLANTNLTDQSGRACNTY